MINKIKTSAVKFLGLIFYVINKFLIFIPKKIKFKKSDQSNDP